MNADDAFDLSSCPLTPERACALVRMMADETISSKQGREVLAAVIDEDVDPEAVVEERGMKQVSDAGAIGRSSTRCWPPIRTKSSSTGAARRASSGFFVGQCMKKMRGQGNPKGHQRAFGEEAGVANLSSHADSRAGFA